MLEVFLTIVGFVGSVTSIVLFIDWLNQKIKQASKK